MLSFLYFHKLFLIWLTFIPSLSTPFVGLKFMGFERMNSLLEMIYGVSKKQCAILHTQHYTIFLFLALCILKILTAKRHQEEMLDASGSCLEAYLKSLLRLV